MNQPLTNEMTTVRTVDVIVPVRNEEEHLPALLDQILRQTYEPDHVFLVVAPSEDATLQIALSFASRYENVVVLENPYLTAPHAMNIALAQSAADAWIRIDGHTAVPSDLLEVLRDELNSVDAACVGPTLVPGARSRMQAAIGAAMSSPVGVGNARFRVGVSTGGPTDSIAFGLYRRSVTDKVGGYETDMVRNQDDQYNTRIRQLGHQLWLTPRVSVRYFPRKTIRALWKQYFEYGHWRFVGTMLYGNQLRLRQTAPLALLVSMAGSFLLALCSSRRAFALIAPGAYAALLGHHAFRTERKGLDASTSVASSAAVLTMHVAYGAGTISGVLYALSRRATGILRSQHANTR